MITRIGMAPRSPGVTFDVFRQHWRTTHAQAAGVILGVRRYVQNHAVVVGYRPSFPYPGFDACSELDFDSIDDMNAGFASNEYQRITKPDEAAFVDKSRFSLFVARAEVIAPEPDHGLKLMSFLRAHPEVGRPALIDVMVGPYGEAVEMAKGRTLFVPAENGPNPACDLIDDLWFSDLAEVNSFLASEGWARAQWELSGKAFGIEHLVSEPLVIV